MSYQVQGAIVRIADTKQISETFSKREFVIEIPDGKYPQLCEFQVTNAKCSLLDGIGTGDIVDVDFNLRGREWTSPKGEVRVFNSLDCWKLERVKQCKGETFAEPDAEADLPF